jgi:hypothetical protein
MVFGQWTRAASSVSGNRERQGREGPRAGARLGTFHQLWNHIVGRRRRHTDSGARHRAVVPLRARTTSRRVRCADLRSPGPLAPADRAHRSPETRSYAGGRASSRKGSPMLGPWLAVIDFERRAHVQALRMPGDVRAAGSGGLVHLPRVRPVRIGRATEEPRRLRASR